MPSRGLSAAFDPIPPDLDLKGLVNSTPNFRYADRITYNDIRERGLEAFEEQVLQHVILQGKPLVIEGFNQLLDPSIFSPQWLITHHGSKAEDARELNKGDIMSVSIGHYLAKLGRLADQWTAQNFRERKGQRVYLKDIDCPPVWRNLLERVVPPNIFYLNQGTGLCEGVTAPEATTIPNLRFENSEGIVPAGDLMSSLPSGMRAENLMCYIGHEGTYTPAHREMCASLGQNLMVEASTKVEANGEASKPGSSIWFMTESRERHIVAEYWRSQLRHDIEVEAHFAQINAWARAPFTTYIVDQRPGDFILIPPLAPHQVWNRGTRTMKVAWNRTTVETLELALHEALPNARMVCRDEQYKNKAIVYFTLIRYAEALQQVLILRRSNLDVQVGNSILYSRRVVQLQKDFRRLFTLFTEILLSEMLAPVSRSEKQGRFIPYDGCLECSFCRCNIFNRYLTCESCIITSDEGEQDAYDMCLECYVMGRSCSCLSGYRWVEQFPWAGLTKKHEIWRNLIIDLEGRNDYSPLSLSEERKRLGKKTLAQVCQEQLKLRPWSDPKRPLRLLSSQEIAGLTPKRANAKDQEIDDEVRNLRNGSGNVKMKPKQARAKRLDPQFIIEHVGSRPRYRWQCAQCSQCSKAYQYGILYRAFDLMPLTVMQNYAWICPACLKICSCGLCLRKADTRPYEPQGTVLGRDFSQYADPRSTDILVKFGQSNDHHLKKLNRSGLSRRYRRRLSEMRAEAQDAYPGNGLPEPDNVTVEEIPHGMDDIQNTTATEMPIDPQLIMSVPNGSMTALNPTSSMNINPPESQATGRYQRHGDQDAQARATRRKSATGVIEASRQQWQTSQTKKNSGSISGITALSSQGDKKLMLNGPLRREGHDAQKYVGPARVLRKESRQHQVDSAASLTQNQSTAPNVGTPRSKMLSKVSPSDQLSSKKERQAKAVNEIRVKKPQEVIMTRARAKRIDEVRINDRPTRERKRRDCQTSSLIPHTSNGPKKNKNHQELNQFSSIHSTGATGKSHEQLELKKPNTRLRAAQDREKEKVSQRKKAADLPNRIKERGRISAAGKKRKKSSGVVTRTLRSTDSSDRCDPDGGDDNYAFDETNHRTRTMHDARSSKRAKTNEQHSSSPSSTSRPSSDGLLSGQARLMKVPRSMLNRMQGKRIKVSDAAQLLPARLLNIWSGQKTK